MTVQGKPDRCPSCGSDERSKRNLLPTPAGYEDLCCDDWHSSPVPAAAPTPDPAQVLVDALEIISRDWWPEVDRDYCCKECGVWSPANHPEADDHRDECFGWKEYRRRADKRQIAKDALASYKQGRKP